LLLVRLSDGYLQIATWVVDGPQQLARPDRDTIRHKIPAETGPRRLRTANAAFSLQHRAAPDIGQIEFLSRSSTGLVHIPTPTREWKPTAGHPTKPFCRADETVLKRSSVNKRSIRRKGASR
jgi:hypothetical protein